MKEAPMGDRVSLSPFHIEAHPSFRVISRKHCYHCHSCGVSGSVIKFLMENQRMSFHQAVGYLTKRYHFYHKQWLAAEHRRAYQKK